MNKEEFINLSREWEGIEYATCGGCLTPEQEKAAVAKQIEIERMQDAAPWEYDEDGNVVEKAPQ